MNIRCEYENSSADWRELRHILEKTSYRRAARHNWNVALAYSLTLVLPIIFLLIAGQIVVACLPLVLIGWHAASVIKFKKRYWGAPNPQYDSLNAISLEISDDGMTEIDREIKSFAPWKTITAIFFRETRTFIQLNSRLWAIIPNNALIIPSSATMVQVLDILHAKPWEAWGVDNSIRFKSHLTKEYYSNIIRMEKRLNRNLSYDAITVVLLLLIWLFFLGIIFLFAFIKIHWLYFVFALLLALPWLLLWYNNHRHWKLIKENKWFNQVLERRINEYGITDRSSAGYVFMKWTSVSKVRRIGEDLILYFGRDFIYLGMKDIAEGSFEELEYLIRKYVSDFR